MWGNPIKETKAKTPKPEEEFKKPKLTLTKSEAKKILYHSGDLSYAQIEWVQRWLQQRIQQCCYPPQLSGSDAFAAILSFLAPNDASGLLSEVRAEFRRTLPQEAMSGDDFAFLSSLALEAYHEHLPPPHTSSRNSRLSISDPESP
jgi:hypothetical protein